MKRKGTLEDIVKQMTARLNRPTVSIKDTNRRNTSRIKYSLDDIGDDTDDG